MIDHQKLRILFTDKAENVFSDMEEKYHWEEGQEANANRLGTTKPSRTMLIKKIVKGLAAEIISQEDFINSLIKVLGVSEETAKTISQDIITNLVPLLVKAPEEKFNDSKFREEISKKVFDDETVVGDVNRTATQDIILEKIKGRSVPPPRPKKPLPAGVKEPATANVEENAKLMEKKKEPSSQEPQPAQDDKYREIIE